MIIVTKGEGVTKLHHNGGRGGGTCAWCPLGSSASSAIYLKATIIYGYAIMFKGTLVLANIISLATVTVSNIISYGYYYLWVL